MSRSMAVAVTVRAVLMAAIAAGFAAAILSHEESVAMAVGMTPIAWLALEGIWRLLAPVATTRETNYAESRTGIRREPKGLPNFW